MNKYKKNKSSISKRIIIVCEGDKTEPNYFRQIAREKGRGLIEIFPPESAKGNNNSPEGLFNHALGLIKNKTISSKDLVWIVFDTDQWQNLDQIRCKIQNKGWYTAQSNPCFEVWLYYHQHTTMSANAPTCSTNFKLFYHNNCDRQTCNAKYIHNAINNTTNSYRAKPDGQPDVHCTEVQTLAIECCSIR